MPYERVDARVDDVMLPLGLMFDDRCSESILAKDECNDAPSEDCNYESRRGNPQRRFWEPAKLKDVERDKGNGALKGSDKQQQKNSVNRGLAFLNQALHT